jgi:hypothetical protein
MTGTVTTTPTTAKNWTPRKDGCLLTRFKMELGTYQEMSLSHCPTEKLIRHHDDYEDITRLDKA